MTTSDYILWDTYMNKIMSDSAHDREHVYRVLYNALDIASCEVGADMGVLVCACLLHDIGRPDQLSDPKLCHAVVGAEKAYKFLTENGYSQDFAAHVRDCVRTHRYRRACPPETTEARILFDADKLDAVGTMGIARTFLYKGGIGDPIYNLGKDGIPSDGVGDTTPSFFQEYKFKLEKLYSGFHTARGRELAEKRRNAAESFYLALLDESRSPYIRGRSILENLLK